MLAAKLEENREFDIQILGTTVRLSLNPLLVRIATDMSTELVFRESGKRQFAEAVFRENLDSLPISVQAKRAIRKYSIIRFRTELVPDLVTMINWNSIRESCLSRNSWSVCPECGYNDPYGYGQGAACPNCS